MPEKKDYTCLHCGSTFGSPDPDKAGTQNWYWKVGHHGRIGPFCSAAADDPRGDGGCADLYCWPERVLSHEPRYTIPELEKLLFWKHVHETRIEQLA